MYTYIGGSIYNAFLDFGVDHLCDRHKSFVNVLSRLCARFNKHHIILVSKFFSFFTADLSVFFQIRLIYLKN